LAGLRPDFPRIKRDLPIPVMRAVHGAAERLGQKTEKAEQPFIEDTARQGHLFKI
jgi:hypothetical protein